MTHTTMDRRAKTRRRAARCSAAAAACLLAVSAHADFVNGSFESGLTGWTASNFFAEGFDHGTDALAHEGAAAFYGGGIGTAGLLSQTVSTVPNQAYVISFWLAGDGYMPNEFTVLANNAPLFQLTDAALLSQTYQQFKVFVSPTSATTTFAFGFRSDSGAFHFDQVSVSAVPEPASALMLALGAGALALTHRARRQGRQA